MKASFNPRDCREVCAYPDREPRLTRPSWSSEFALSCPGKGGMFPWGQHLSHTPASLSLLI